MTQTLKDVAYSHIRGQLATGRLPSGTRVSPIALAKEIGISHIPVREALSRLQSEGWLMPHPGRGLSVREIDRRELVESYEVRTALECAAVAKAAKRITRQELDQAQVHLRELKQIADSFQVDPHSDVEKRLASWMLADLAFHMVLLRASNNRKYIKVIDNLRLMTQMFGYRTDPPSAWTNPVRYFFENYAVHESVFQAVAAGNAKAARRAMRTHMRLACRTMLARYDQFRRRRESATSASTEFPESMRRRVREIEQGGE